MAESSDKLCSTGEGNGKPLQYACLENPTNSMKRQKDVTLEDEPPQVSRCPVGYWGRVEKQLQKEWLNGHEFEQTLEDSDGQGNLVCCNSWGGKDGLRDWTTGCQPMVVWFKKSCMWSKTSLMAKYNQEKGQCFLAIHFWCQQKWIIGPTPLTPLNEPQYWTCLRITMALYRLAKIAPLIFHL